MTSIYDKNGKAVACTIVQAGPCVVTQVKNEETDGYKSIQLAFGDRKEKNTPKAIMGHMKKANSGPKSKMAEFKGFENPLNLGDTITVELFAEGEFVDVVGTSKGKGFQGVVKRHGFSGVGGNTHGQHDRQRAPGSIGASSFPSKVFKGMRMAGRTGGVRVKKTNLEIIKVIKDQNLLVVKGAVPGPKGSFVLVEK